MMRLPVLVAVTFFAASLFGAGHDLATPPPNTSQWYPVVTGNGSGFIAAWLEGLQIASGVVSAAGDTVRGAAIGQLSVRATAIAHSPSDTLVAWIADGNVYAERLSPSGVALNLITLTSHKDSNVAGLAVAWYGGRYFVVWSNQLQLLGAFIAPDGSSTSPHVFFSEPLTEPGPRSYFAVEPDVAWDGQHFIVVFSEVRNEPCLSLCSPPQADHCSVMRVSAAGEPIDRAPRVIPNPQNGDLNSRAHVASSGAESLIALDSQQLSTMIVRDEEDLIFGPVSSVFDWYLELRSAVVWDGVMYAVGWRYGSVDSKSNWIALAHVTRSGIPLDYRITPVGRSIFSDVFSMAVNDAGTAAFVTSELTPALPERVRLYLSPEFPPMPAPPPAPVNVVSYFGGGTARIDWQSETAAAFKIERSVDFGKTWGFNQIVRGDARTTKVLAVIGNLFRVRAFGPGGLSDGTMTSIGSMPRRRAERH